MYIKLYIHCTLLDGKQHQHVQSQALCTLHLFIYFPQDIATITSILTADRDNSSILILDKLQQKEVNPGLRGKWEGGDMGGAWESPFGGSHQIRLLTVNLKHNIPRAFKE